MRSGNKLFLFAKVILFATLLLEGCKSNYASSARTKDLLFQNDRSKNQLLFTQVTQKNSEHTLTATIDLSELTRNDDKSSPSYQWLDSMVVNLKSDERKSVTAGSRGIIRNAESIHLY